MNFAVSNSDGLYSGNGWICHHLPLARRDARKSWHLRHTGIQRRHWVTKLPRGLDSEPLWRSFSYIAMAPFTKKTCLCWFCHRCCHPVIGWQNKNNSHSSPDSPALRWPAKGKLLTRKWTPTYAIFSSVSYISIMSWAKLFRSDHWLLNWCFTML